MFSSFAQYALFALAVNLQYVKAVMVESVDGSFVPLSFVARAPGEGLAVRMKNNKDLAYLATVLMGTPAQQIQMAVSLSQNHISVASPPGGVTDQSYYNPAASTSYIPGNAAANITTISGGTTTGRFAGETCTIQSATSALSFTYNASVVLTDPSVSNDVFPPGARAILGYGVNAPPGSPPGTSLIPSFLPANFTNAVCGIEMNHFDDPFPDGILTMGAVDSAAFTGDFTNVMVPSSSVISWSIPVDTITYLANGTSQGVAGSLASIDMYHTGIQVTNDVARQIYSGTPGAQAISETTWSIPCSSTFPITLTFAGKPFTINERDTIIQQPSGMCTGVVTGGATQIGKVGAPFMRNFYRQFAAAKDASGSVEFSVGFAEKKQAQTPATSVTASPQTTIKPNPSATSTSTPSGGAQTIQSLPTLVLIVVPIAVMIFL
ncbi:hypothetical protein M413DRAFT_449600 [Hebeloma cylindrosporum]|uniref:Peptidase A1 domain-containing protein n=1 Tax=Hebeloma cylindrosporum TaxID=76867 RepID=A0A0C3BWK5_HEBCY|nr:hypothetical protein M413DRAFT_449600 [Hebeloma cylindrosporum h7]